MSKRPDFITAKEAAQKLGIHLDTVYHLLLTKKIPSYKIGRRYRIDPRELDGWLIEHRNK